MKTTTVILTAMALTIIMFVARAEIASKAYVDYELSGKMDTVAVDSTPISDSANLVYSGGVAAAIAAAIYDDTKLINRLNKVGADVGKDVSSGNSMEYILDEMARNKAENHGYGSNAIMTTDSNGYIQSTTGSFLTDEHIANNARISLEKLFLPKPSAACQTQGCILMFYNSQYVWEPIMRGDNETVAVTGGVSGLGISQAVTVVTSEAGREGTANASQYLVCQPESRVWSGKTNICFPSEI